MDLLINVNTIASDDFRKHYSAVKKAEKIIILRIKYTSIYLSKMDIIASDARKNTKWGHMVKTKTKGLLSIT